MYLAFSLLAITSCAVCMSVAYDNGFDPLSDYTTFFYSTSYGAFSAQYNKCQYSLISGNFASFSLTCPKGLLNATVTTAIMPAVVSNESLATLFNCRQERLSLEKN